MVNNQAINQSATRKTLEKRSHQKTTHSNVKLLQNFLSTQTCPMYRVTFEKTRPTGVWNLKEKKAAHTQTCQTTSTAITQQTRLINLNPNGLIFTFRMFTIHRFLFPLLLSTFSNFLVEICHFFRVLSFFWVFFRFSSWFFDGFTHRCQLVDSRRLFLPCSNRAWQSCHGKPFGSLRWFGASRLWEECGGDGNRPAVVSWYYC